MFGHDGAVDAPDEVAREHRTGAANAETPRGLFEGFESYRTPTEADYRGLLTRGLIVPDTNVFLNLYRYNEQTRNDFLAVLNALGDRLWVPRQVIAEFWRNREKVLQDPRDTEKTIRELVEQRDRTIETLRAWVNRVGLSNERKIHFSRILSVAFDSVAEDVKSLSDDHAFDFAQNTNRDPVLTALEPILKGRVGAPLEKVEHENALREAKRRAEAKQPPGYKDVAKTGEATAGDYLIWIQILNELRSRPRDVLIVTGDVKDDWWRRERGELRGPRPELAEELNSGAGVRLFMLRPNALLLLASRILKTKVRDESLEDIERTDKYLTEALRPSIEVIQAAWEEIVAAVKRRSRVAWALLRNAIPENLAEDVLTVEFRSDGETKGFLVSGHEKMLTDAILDVIGVRLRIAAVAQSGVSPNTHSVGDTGKELTGMELIQRELGGQLIGEPSSGYSDEPPF
jgi:predicted nucleic acid-binding protein